MESRIEDIFNFDLALRLDQFYSVFKELDSSWVSKEIC